MLNKHRGEKRDRYRDDDVPLSAFADIAFLLIIFFIITASFIKTKGMTTEIPSGEKSEKAEEKTPTVQLTADKMMFEGKQISWKRLEKTLLEMKLPERTTEKDKIILLEAKAGVEYQDYFRAMVTISKSGGLVSIVREQKDKKK